MDLERLSPRSILNVLHFKSDGNMVLDVGDDKGWMKGSFDAGHGEYRRGRWKKKKKEGEGRERLGHSGREKY